MVILVFKADTGLVDQIRTELILAVSDAEME